MDSVLVEQLRHLYHTNPAARAFFDYAASRERNRSETNIERVHWNLTQNGSGIGRSELIQVLRSLEELGCGRYVEGRHGYPSRFAWTANIIDVGRVAGGQDVGTGETPPIAAEPQEGSITHRFHLRADFEVELELPTDLSTREAERLAAFVRTLPIEGEQ